MRKRADRPVRYDYFDGQPIPVWELAEESIDLRAAGEAALRCVKGEKRGFLSLFVAAVVTILTAVFSMFDVS